MLLHVLELREKERYKQRVNDLSLCQITITDSISNYNYQLNIFSTYDTFIRFFRNSNPFSTLASKLRKFIFLISFAPSPFFTVQINSIDQSIDNFHSFKYKPLFKISRKNSNENQKELSPRSVARITRNDESYRRTCNNCSSISATSSRNWIRRRQKGGRKVRKAIGARSKKKRPFNTMRFIGEMRLTIITTGTDEFSLVPLFEDEAVTRGEREEARFNLTGEDVPLDKCPRTIHLQRNSWPFFPLRARTPRDRPYSKGSPFGTSLVSSRPSQFFARRIPADIVSISTKMRPPLVI